MNRIKNRLPILILLIFGVSISLAAQTGGRGRSLPGATKYTLTINSNAPNSTVYIGNSRVGSAPHTAELEAGNYNIRIRAEGFQEYATSITLNRNMTINANLEPDTHIFRVLSNIQNAQVFLDDEYVGRSGRALQIPGGRYQLKVTAPGHFDYVTSVNLNRDLNMNVELEPMTATLKVVIPRSLLNRNDRSALAKIKVFIDDRVQNRNTSEFELAPGVHQVRIETGGIVTETEIDLAAGQVYQLNLMFQLEAVNP